MADELDSIVDEMIDKKPEPSPFIETMLEKETGDGAENEDEPVTANGTPPEPVISAPSFDPSIHSADEWGNPVKNLDGSFRKKRGRKPGVKNSQSTQSVVDPAELENRCKFAADLTVQCLVIIGSSIGGNEEWEPNLDEKSLLEKTWKDYYKTIGGIAIPPWIGVAIVTGMYVRPRLTKPNTRQRIVKFFGSFSRIVGWFKKRGDKQARLFSE